MEDVTLNMNEGASKAPDKMKEHFQNPTSSDATSADNGQEDVKTEESTVELFTVNNNDGKTEYEGYNFEKKSRYKHKIVEVLGESVSYSTLPPRKKCKKEKVSEHPIVKQNQTPSPRQFDSTKRKTKKMADMQDFLERERNVSLLNDICRSKFGSRKKCKKNITSENPTFSSSVSVEPDCSDNTDSIITFPKHLDIPQFESSSCGNESIIKDSEINAISTSQGSSPSIGYALKDLGEENQNDSGEKGMTNSIREYENSLKFKMYSSSVIKNEIEIEDHTNYMNEETQSSVLNLKISNVKGSAWIDDPDGYTSDETALVIDEGTDTIGSNKGGGEERNDEEKHTEEASLDVSKENSFYEPESQSRIFIKKIVSKPETKSGSVALDSCNDGRYQERSHPDNYSSCPSSRKEEGGKNTYDYTNYKNCYIIEVQEENKLGKDSLSNLNCVKKMPIKKIKIKKVEKSENLSSSNCRRNESRDLRKSNYSLTGSRVDNEDIIIDVDSDIETKQEDIKNKHSISGGAFRSKTGTIVYDVSEQIVTSSNTESVSSLKTDSTKSHCSSCHKQKGKPPPEFNTLQRKLERGDCNRQEYRRLQDPMTNRTVYNKVDNLQAKPQLKPQLNDDGGPKVYQISEPHLFYSYADISRTNSFGEFSKVIYLMYRELLTPHSQNLIRQLTEVLHLVISESVRYSDRCRRSGRVMSPEHAVQDQILAHRDFQANTTFYAMYFTHLFRNVVQYFPVTKEYHSFMYLALFVNISRQLRSMYNVHPSYIHIARKLIISMLKANAYNDTIVFSAICKPDFVFETDYVLVSQLIDSFSDNMRFHMTEETNYALEFSRSIFQPTNTPVIPCKNMMHPEFPAVQMNTATLPLNLVQTPSVSQSQTAPSLKKLLMKDDSSSQGSYKNPLRNIKPAPPKDPRVNVTSFEPEARNLRKSRPPVFLVSQSHSPVTQTTQTGRPSLWLMTTPKSSSTSLPTSTLATSVSKATAIHGSSSLDVTNNSAGITNPSDFNSSNTSMTQPSSPSAADLCEHQSNVYVWKPRAIHPRYRPCLPYNPTTHFYLMH